MLLTPVAETVRRSTIGILCIITLITVPSVTGWAAGILPPGLVGPEMVALEIPTVHLEAFDPQVYVQQDLGKPTGPEDAGPARFAVGLDTSISPSNSGQWEELPDGRHLWRVEVAAPGALSLNLRIEDLNLPAGSRLWIHDPKGSQVHGPYAQKDRDPFGGLSTPIILGDHLVVEVAAPAGRKPDVQAVISGIHRGYRIFGEEVSNSKQGSCNIDVICPEGDDWRDQIRSVARYTVQISGSTYLCTGTLMNNTAEDERPLFLTADHCGVTDTTANTVVVYWNYESANCGDLSGGSLSQNQTGVTFLSTWDWDNGSDFTLLELNTVPSPLFNVYYAGWDVSGRVPQSATGIHHPSGAVKAISFENDPLTEKWGSHWQVNDWDLGTTEPGSSGSCLFDQSNGLCVGTLSGGYAACGNDLEDWFGQIHSSWTGGGTADSRLSDYLDPLATGATTLQGKNPSGSGATTQWLIPAAASKPGYGTSNWKTQIAVANPSSATITAALYFVAEGSSWPGSMLPGTHSIPAGGALYIDDPLADLNPTSGLMYVTVTSSKAVVSTRTYTLENGSATFGQGIPGIPLDTAKSATSLILPLIHSAPDAFHTNLGIVQTSAGSLLVRATVHGPSGTIIAAKAFAQDAAFRQINDVFSNMGIGGQSIEGGWIEVELIGGSPAYWTAYASIVDDRTNDPTYLAGVVR